MTEVEHEPSLEEQYEQFKTNIGDPLIKALEKECKIKGTYTDPENIELDVFEKYIALREKILEKIYREIFNIKKEELNPEEFKTKIQVAKSKLQKYCVYHFKISTPGLGDMNGLDYPGNPMIDGYKEELEKLKRENQE